jgi:dynein heavy chain, axonemal
MAAAASSRSSSPLAGGAGSVPPSPMASSPVRGIISGSRGLGPNEAVAWVRSLVRLKGLRSAMWTPDHEKVIETFLYNPECPRLIVYMTKVGDKDELALLTPFTSVPVAPRQYFYVARTGNVALNIDNIRSNVQFGMVSGGSMDSLLRVVKGAVLPSVRTSVTWPEGMRKDFVSQLHKFTASLVEASNQAKGKTVLYIPDEALPSKPTSTSLDKDTAQLLDATVLHWTRQVREVVSQQQDMSSQAAESAGPLEEIAFWRLRREDLSSIAEQLQQDQVKQVVACLQAVKSRYLGPFGELATAIEEGSRRAEDNERFLSVLTDVCEKLASSTPTDIPAIFPDLLSRIRFVGEACEYFRDPLRLTGLIRKVSNEVIRRCVASINLDNVFGQDVLGASDKLSKCLECGDAWRRAYDRTVTAVHLAHAKAEEDGVIVPGCKWDLDEKSIFAQLNAFSQRCRDLLQVCNAQVQFSRKGVRGSTEQTPLPMFGGSRGPEIAEGIRTVEEQFETAMEPLRRSKGDILDVKKASWPEINTQFKADVKELEVMLSNVIDSAMEGVDSIELSTSLLEAFSTLAHRPAIVKCVEKHTQGLYGMFISRMVSTKGTFERYVEKPPLRPEEPPFAGAALWTRGIFEPIERDWVRLSAARAYLPPCDEMSEAEKLFLEHSASYAAHISRLFAQWTTMLTSELKDADAMNSRLEKPLLSRAAAVVEDDDGADAGNGATLKGMAQERAVDRTVSGRLENNFDKGITRLFAEVHGWEKFGGTHIIPFHAMDLKTNHREKLRTASEHVMEVVRDYNRVLDSILPDERRLFSSALQALDRDIMPGLTRITWRTEAAQAEMFLRRCRVRTLQAQAAIDRFHELRSAVSKVCDQIAATSVVDIDRSRPYPEGAFERAQARHREKVRRTLSALHDEHKRLVTEMYSFFRESPVTVQRAWVRYVRSVDDRVFRALRSTVKAGQQQIQRIICGDPKAEAEQQPLLNVTLTLSPKGVVCQPDIVSMIEMMSSVTRSLFNVTAAVPRLLDILPGCVTEYRASNSSLERELAQAARAAGLAMEDTPDAEAAEVALAHGLASKPFKKPVVSSTTEAASAEAEAPPPSDTAVTAGAPTLAPGEQPVTAHGVGPESGQPPFFEKISNDAELLDVMAQSMEGMSKTMQTLESRSQAFDRYEQLWSKPKDRFFHRYASAAKPVDAFSKHISMYREYEEEIRVNEPAFQDIDFVHVDHSVLKQQLIGHCEQFQRGLTDILHDQAKDELQSLVSFMRDTAERLSRIPADLSELRESTSLHKTTTAKMADTEARFAPLDSMYSLLERQEVQLAPEETSKREALGSHWSALQDAVGAADGIIKKAKTGMKKGLQDDLTSFQTAVAQIAKDAVTGLPFRDQETIAIARDMMQDFQKRCQAARERLRKLGPGLEVFEIPPPEPEDLKKVERQLELLTALWDLYAEWEESWMAWSAGTFSSLDTEDLGMRAAKYKQTLGRMREAERWAVHGALKTKIVNFISTMPLITDLADEAMRERHWSKLKEHIGADFDETSDSFTLATVFDLKLYEHAEFIAELSNSARQELKIERELAGIGEIWATMKIEMGPYKEEYWKITTTDDLFLQLEENMGTLSTIKGSKFYLSFKEAIDGWEASLSLVSEVIELQLNVQRAWMYLESIFQGNETITASLPKESALFAQVNRAYQAQTAQMAADRVALRACSADGYLKGLNEMDQKLETIQKSLDDYLEARRQDFPRFYFISNADLLEILGQSNNPKNVAKHFKSCFEGIKDMELVKGSADGSSKEWEARDITAPDGERVQLERPAPLVGPVEYWMNTIEDYMRLTVCQKLTTTLAAYGVVRKTPMGPKKLRRIRAWIEQNPGQLLITTGMIQFTRQGESALDKTASGDAKALKKLVKGQKIYLKLLAAIVQDKDLSKLNRRKTVALITMELHTRDVLTRLYKGGASSRDDFLWLSQLRLDAVNSHGGINVGTHEVKEYSKDYAACVALQTTSELEFGYEYQGNNGRLVVTPLTDRCVLTLTTALFMYRGGAPAGPAGTGKTETVKDLGKNLAKYVVVTNCSDQLDYISVGRMFSGLVQSGSWGCFDEFNRIQIEVLSVVAQQVMSIMEALRAHRDQFEFMGNTIKCRPCGIFITMNPGYAGRTELPDNLKSLFRPVAMMVPDMQLIAEVMLAAEGFENALPLAEKTVTLYDLMVQQLSKQSHYDYGLRSLRGVLVCAGALKRDNPKRDEEIIVLQAIRDMNVPKFIKEDKDLFMLLLGDLFPGMELPESDVGSLGKAIDESLLEAGLQQVPVIRQKCVELRDSKETRHCNMLVGLALSGKSVTWKTLAAARTKLAKSGAEGYKPVRVKALNPKSISMAELYGAFDFQTMEWTDGILSAVFREFAKDERDDDKWLVLDGPVDTLWIESMNTVMDDNKTLTLINGDRIAMSSTMRLVFEVRDLAVASPATVSRAGMIYLDGADLGYMPFVRSWVARTTADNGSSKDADAKLLLTLFEKWVPPLLEVKRTQCSEPVAISAFNAVISLCRLFDACTKRDDSGLSRSNLVDEAAFAAFSEKWFLFSIVWSLGGAMDENSRRVLTDAMREIEGIVPAVGSAYDYFVEPSSFDFKSWADVVDMSWTPPPNAPFSRLIVPTQDTERNLFIMRRLLQSHTPFLVVGATGTGKTVLVQQLMEGLDRDNWHKLTLNFSAATSSKTVQEIMEGSLEKKSKDKMGPPGGRRLVVFIDDLNMPKKDEFGSQPPLELMRQWIGYGGWYDRAKQSWKHIVDIQLCAAMGPPGGGRSVISERLQSCFNVVNFTFPGEKEVQHIFEAILRPYFSVENKFAEEVSDLVPALVAMTVGLYQGVVATFLPTPSKAHYLFNLRDIARVVQGLLRAEASQFPDRDSVVRLWTHESMRVFSDRFTSMEDMERFRKKLLDAQLSKHAETFYDKVVEACEVPEAGPVICAFSPPGDERPYGEVTDMAKLKHSLEIGLQDYNDDPKHIAMELVLFRDAIRHVCRIHRVLSQPRGNALLIGMGGSGRQSLARLAAHMTGEMRVFQIEITKHYGPKEFHEDLKLLCNKTGVDGEATCFLFSDTQLKDESFLEDINNILSSGEVPNLFDKDELGAIYEAMRPIARREERGDAADELWALFVERVRANLHVVLAMSPVGDGFRDRTRMYPALVSATTMDWFHEWPVEALTEVATRFLEDVVFVQSDSHVEETAAAPAAAPARGGGKAADPPAGPTPEQLNAKIKTGVAAVFASAHKSVTVASARMVLELKRFNYVTPTNFLELVRGYRSLMGEKRREIGDSRDKLVNGLAKLDEAREQVDSLSIVLKDKTKQVADKTKACEDMLADIMSERAIADTQKKDVEETSERISKEREDCQAIADDAERDLAKALPMLENALAEVNKLDKGAVAEVKNYTSPPDKVELTMDGVMILFKLKTGWESAKRKLSEADFLRQIIDFDKENISEATLRKLQKYISNPNFQPTKVAGQSKAAATLCSWVIAMDTYAKVSKTVEPKREAMRVAMQRLEAKEEALAAAQEKLRAVIERVNELAEKHQRAVDEKNELKAEAEALAAKLDRASRLVEGLGSEKGRWQISIKKFSEEMQSLPGDVLVASAFLSYAGPFDTTYRSSLVDGWLRMTHDKEIPLSDGFDFSSFLAKPTVVQGWNLLGLPADSFSTENGVIVTRGSRWPLMVDPQGQANKWIKKLEAAELKITDLKARDFLKVLESCIRYGLPYLLQDVEQELDPSLEPVLSKAIVVRGSRKTIRLGDKELDYNDDFRFYVTTKLPNPHYTPEVSTKTTIVNFSVKQEGLEAQLLSVVVVAEKPKLEQQKKDLMNSVAEDQLLLVELEDRILHLISSTKGSLLDDANLVDTLQESKVTSTSVQEKMASAAATEKIIDATREGYRPVAFQASLLYFVLADLSSVDPMYQFSLDAYVGLFKDSIAKSKEEQAKNAGLMLDAPPEAGGDAELKARIDAINSFHTGAVYGYACRALFERHKLLLSLQITARKMLAEGALPKALWDFFLKGGQVLDRSEQRPNPSGGWLDKVGWDNVTVLDSLPGFAGLVNAIESGTGEWEYWFKTEAPEEEDVPGGFDGRLSELQHMCLIRAIRPDRVLRVVRTFVAHNLGPEFVDPPPNRLRDLLDASDEVKPVIFVLSPGVDPTRQLLGLLESEKARLRAASRDEEADRMRLEYCSLGQGQAPTATRMILKALEEGTWVFLQNCHLSISWMPALEKIIDDYVQLASGEGGGRVPTTAGGDPICAPAPGFRLWLSSSPHDRFPISVLQRSIKITTEPPRGLKANLLRLYNIVDRDQFEISSETCPGSSYPRLLFSLCWFHSVLIERRKFKALGWNIPYEFTNADFSICDDILSTYLRTYPDKTPWDAIRYLVAEANYGGRITDDLDRRLCNVYVRQFFCDDVLEHDSFRLSDSPIYVVPPDGEYDSYVSYVETLPSNDPPAAFGQHPNADIQSAIEDSRDLLLAVLSLQPRDVSSSGEKDEDKVLALAEDLEKQVPEPFNGEAIRKAMRSRDDPAPLKTVLFQETDRYTSLLVRMKDSLVALQKGIQGLVVITSELEDIFASLLRGQVPSAWMFCYPSLKPLGSWMSDLIERCIQMRKWSEDAMPPVVWLGGFTYPTSLLTAVLQTKARKDAVAINRLSYTFPIVERAANAIKAVPEDGVYVSGLFLEGARWDVEAGYLSEPQAMSLFDTMPVVHFLPTVLKAEGKKKASAAAAVGEVYAMYDCPMYLYPVRTGTRERPSFIRLVGLNAGTQHPDFWIKRGTALLLALAQ